jgi:AraC-like DNA-binding protein
MDKIIKKKKSVTPVFNSSFNGSATLYLLDNTYSGRISDNRCALIYTINGFVTVKTERTTVLSDGQVMLLNGSCDLTVKSVGNTKANCVIIIFNDSFVNCDSFVKGTFLSKVSPNTAMYFNSIISNLSSEEKLYSITVKNLLFALLSDVISSTLIFDKRDISELAKHFKSSADGFLLNCERIYDVYKKYNVSHTSLIKEFKTLTGKTPVEYVAIKRLENACSLLLNTSLTVEEISNCLDYTSVSHFIKKFKFYFNTTPLSYRKSNI